MKQLLVMHHNVELKHIQQENPHEDVDENQQIVLQDTPLDEEDISRSKRHRKVKTYGPDFHVYLVEGTRNDVHSSVPNLLNVEGDLLTYSDTMASQDSSFWKEAIKDEMDSIREILRGY